MTEMETWLSSEGTTIMTKLGFTFLMFLVLGILRRVLIRVVNNASQDAKERYHWRNIIRYSIVIIGLVAFGFIWVDQVGSVATFLGLVSAGLVIALKEPVLNIAGFLFIVIRRPFDVGDRIEIGNQAGDVIDVRLFQFTINEIRNWVEADQSTGRIIHIPNSRVFTEPQTNFNKGLGYLWNEVGVTLTFESNWKKAKKIMAEIGEKHSHVLTEAAKKGLVEASKKYMIFYSKFDPIVYTSIRENGVKLSIRYITKHQQRRGSENAIFEDLLDAFTKESDITIAYPTQRVFYRPGESGQKE